MRSAPDVTRLLSPGLGMLVGTLLLLLGCGAAPRPVPAPVGVPLVRPGVVGELADLARRAEVVVSAVVVHARPTRRGCQRVWQLELLPVTVLKGRADFFDVGLLAEAPEGACVEAPLEVFARAGEVSLQRPSLLFLASEMVREGQAGPEVPPDFGLERVGPVVLGAAPLEALDALAPLLAGDPWPVPPLGPRALKVGEHTVVDEATGLTWQRRGSGPLREARAHRHCAALELDGHADWRLPSVLDASSLFRHGETLGPFPADAFPELVEDWYWTGTDDDGAWVFAPATGDVTSTHYDDPSPYGSYHALCVRSHRGALPRTPRFRVEGETVVDPLSDRTWHAGVPALRSLPEARAFCGSLRIAGHADWRLPTVQEALTLLDVGGPGDEELDLFPVAREEDAMWTATRVGADPDEVFEMRHPGSLHFWPAGSFVGEGEVERKNAICVRTGAAPPPEAPDAQARYPSGQPAAVGRVVEGLREGPWSFFDRRGRRLARVGWRGGVADGAAEHDYPDGAGDGGRRRLEVTMAGGVRHGPATVSGAHERTELRYCAGLACGHARSSVDGRLVAEGRYEAGRRVGEHRRWHPDGTLAEVVRYEGGELHGPSEGWYADGKRAFERHFERGRRHGRQREWHPDGAVMSDAELVHGTGAIHARDAQGRPLSEAAWKDGKPDGAWVTYREGRKSAAWSYRDGVLHGAWHEWHDNGQKQRERTFVDGQQHGPEVGWHANGQKAVERLYEAGRPTGSLTEWDDAGRLDQTGQFDAAGRRDGEWVSFHEGRKVQVATWRAGELLDVEWMRD